MVSRLLSVANNIWKHRGILFAHVEISWDVILTEDGPVHLEGNTMPPGCDYKLTVFKKWENFKYLRNKILKERFS
jgi:hypothetical protein